MPHNLTTEFTSIEIQRFWSKVNIGAPNECWEWQAYRMALGYGSLTIRQQVTLAHRFSYEVINGSIPEHLTLDHLCRNPPCVNPDHLEPVSHRTNVLRGTSPSAINARKTHCVHGHEFTSENTYTSEGKSGQLERACRICRRIKRKEYYENHRK